MEFSSKVFFLGASTKGYTNRQTGQAAVSYRAAIEDEGVVHIVRMSKEVYDKVKDIKHEDVTVTLKYEEYNNVGSLRLLGVEE